MTRRTMNRSELLHHLVDLESLLHRPEVRRDPERLRKLLHPEFEEIGRSGRRYSREDVLSEARRKNTLTATHTEDFELAAIADGVALLTYRSAHVDENGVLDRWAHRASLWLRAEEGWKMRFHQGTPAEPGHGHVATVVSGGSVTGVRVVRSDWGGGLQYCSFCGKLEEETSALIRGPAVAICDGCVALAAQAVQDQDGVH